MVIIYGHKDPHHLREVLSYDFNLVFNFVNLKPGKTETVLFATAQNLKRIEHLEIRSVHENINAGEEYEYLGTVIDNSLSFNSHFDKVTKKVYSRMNLLSRIRKDISSYVSENIYKSMIQPLLLSNENGLLVSSRTQINKFESL